MEIYIAECETLNKGKMMSSADYGKQQKSKGYISRLLAQVPLSLFSATVLIALYIGWQQREEYWLTAERGLGYALGIIGGIMMLLMLLYPLRKNWKVLSNVFRVKDWFRAHMILGILGPTLILFHSNFKLGSTNSNVALFSMLLVVFSGLIGRYVYRQIHHGLYGSQVSYKELLADYDAEKQLRKFPVAMAKKISADMESIQSQTTGTSSSLLTQWQTVQKVSKSSKQLIKRLNKIIRLVKKKVSDAELADLINLRVQIKKEVAILKRMSRLAFYSHLFSLWHILHLPIFLMLVITANVHVIVVHMY